MKYLNYILFPWLFAFLASCGSDGPSNNNEEVEPPAPPIYDYEEDEPNNTLINANFITALPSDMQTVHGFISPPDGADCFYFFLNALPGDTEIHLTFRVDMTYYTTPKVTLYQTMYDELGAVTGEYRQIGTFVGEESFLGVIQWPIPYDF